MPVYVIAKLEDYTRTVLTADAADSLSSCEPAYRIYMFARNV